MSLLMPAHMPEQQISVSSSSDLLMRSKRHRIKRYIQRFCLDATVSYEEELHRKHNRILRRIKIEFPEFEEGTLDWYLVYDMFDRQSGEPIGGTITRITDTKKR